MHKAKRLSAASITNTVIKYKRYIHDYTQKLRLQHRETTQPEIFLLYINFRETLCKMYTYMRCFSAVVFSSLKYAFDRRGKWKVERLKRTIECIAILENANQISNKKKVSRLEKREKNLLSSGDSREVLVPVILSKRTIYETREGRRTRGRNCRMFSFNERRDKWL